MSPAPKEPFGRRGRPPAGGGAVASVPLRHPVPQPERELPPELLASILQAAPQEAIADGAKAHKIAWSFRAAVLAGLIVGLFNAAVNATSFLSFGTYGDLMKDLPLGDAKMPLLVTVAAAGLWGGARASALTLLLAHSILDRIGQTSAPAYVCAGAAASGLYAIVTGLLGFDSAHLAMDVMVGGGAGFFYRLFAARA